MLDENDPRLMHKESTTKLLGRSDQRSRRKKSRRQRQFLLVGILVILALFALVFLLTKS